MLTFDSREAQIANDVLSKMKYKEATVMPTLGMSQLKKNAISKVIDDIAFSRSLI
jgi:hypothetical protein